MDDDDTSPVPGFESERESEPLPESEPELELIPDPLPPLPEPEPLPPLPPLPPVPPLPELPPPPVDTDALSPRHRAARVLVRCTAVAWLTLVGTQVLGAFGGGGLLSETATQLMLTVGSALVAATAAYLVRRVERPPDPALENNVGWWLAMTLGGMLLLMSLGPLLYVVKTLLEGEVVHSLGTNALNLLSVLFGGAIGALGAYLGLRAEGERRHKRDDDDQ